MLLLNRFSLAATLQTSLKSPLFATKYFCYIHTLFMALIIFKNVSKNRYLSLFILTVICLYLSDVCCLSLTFGAVEGEMFHHSHVSQS